MRRVLHIERRPDVAAWVRAVLEAEGYEVTTQENGKAGIGQLGNASFDFVLLSLEVPVKPAGRVIEWIAAKRPHLLSRTLAVVDTTLRPGMSAVLEALDVALLFSPFTSGELVQRMRALEARCRGQGASGESFPGGHALAS